MNLGSIFAEHARNTPDKPAVICAGEARTFAGLDERANRCAQALRALGVGRGDRVMLHLPNSLDIVDAIFGVYRVGAIVNPINVMATAEEIAYICDDCTPSVLITTPFLHSNVADAFTLTKHRPLVLTVGGPVPDGAQDFHALVAAAASTPLSTDVPEDTVCSLLYTSGTTGRPKGAMISHGNIMNNVLAATTLGAAAADDVTINPGMPLFHMYAQYWLDLSLYLGATQVLMPYFFPPELFAAITEYQVTAMTTVPTMLSRILADPGVKDCDFSHLRVCGSAADALPLELARRWEELTHLPLTEGYGLTETAPLTSIHPLEGPRKPGSVGPALGCEVRIVDEEDNDMPVGESGEIIVRGKNVMLGYWNKPEATAEMIRDGWLHTGDIGRLDEDGYLYVMDRKKDLIITGGLNIYPAEVERVLYDHPAVVMCAVVGVPDPELGERTKAYIMLRDGATTTEDEIIEFCKQHMAKYKVPRLVEFRPFLPMNATGKVLKRVLRDEARAQATA